MINPRQVRILVVDDDSSVREVLATRFSIFGFQTIMAASGEDGWQKISGDPNINIVVTDLTMPGMSGQDLLKKIKMANPALPRVFAITGQPQWSVETLYALGAEGVLHKPFDARTLLNITRSSLLSFYERLRYPPYATPNTTLKLSFPSIAEALPHVALGRGGFYAMAPMTLPSNGQPILLDLNLGEVSLKGSGSIRWQRAVNGQGTACGIEYTHLKAESLKSLERWLEVHSAATFIPSPQISTSMPSMAKLQSTG